MLWGIAGFVSVHFAPAIGLPPEVPGVAAADLVDRQIWGSATVIATAAAIWLIAFGRGWTAWGAAVVLLLAPHLVGAPQPAAFAGPVPPELGALFAGRALGTGLAAWVALGAFAGYFWQRETAGVSVPQTA
jgi:cobalt transporter subunit CbtA